MNSEHLGGIAGTLSKVDLRASKVLALVAGVVALVVMLLITANVIGRYVFHYDIPGTLEISEWSMPLMVFFSLAYFDITRGHIGINLLVSRLSPKKQTWFRLFTSVISLVIISLMTWQTFNYFLQSLASREATWGMVTLPMFIPKLTISLGCLFFSFHYLYQIVSILIPIVKRRGRADD